MTNEEALETLKARYADKSWIDILDHVQDTSVWQNAIEALEKQIPKKPKLRLHAENIHWYDCPRCGCGCDAPRMPFCGNCGQALNWNEAMKGD